MKKIINKLFENVILIFKPHLYNKKKKLIFFYKLIYFLFRKIITNPIIVNFGSFKIYAYDNKKDLSKFILKNLVMWDGHQVKYINNIIKNKSSLFIDCGCSFGSYSIPIAKLNSENCKIIAIDASNVAINRIKENILLNKIENIELLNIGIDEKEGYKNFNENLKTLPNSGAARFDINGEKKKVTSLDKILENKNLDIFDKIFVKMDLEGYEYNALLGFEKTILKFRPIILFEFSRMLINNELFSEISFDLFLKKISYEIRDNKNIIVSVKNLIEKLNKKEKKYEVLGDFILVSKKL